MIALRLSDPARRELRHGGRAIVTERTDPAPFRLAQSIPVLASERLVRSLSAQTKLSQDEVAALRSLPFVSKKIRADDILMRQGCRQAFLFLILTGVALRYKYLVSGKRQVFGYCLPGDLCEARFIVTNAMDYEIAATSDVTAALIPTSDLTDCVTHFPNIRRALVRSMEADCAALQDCVINVGRRNAVQRLAHFLGKTWRRLRTAGGAGDGQTLRLPLSQLDIADTMGLTVAHVSRCMQQLRRANLIVWTRRALIVLDLDGLDRVAHGAGWAALGESARLTA